MSAFLQNILFMLIIRRIIPHGCGLASIHKIDNIWIFIYIGTSLPLYNAYILLLHSKFINYVLRHSFFSFKNVWTMQFLERNEIYVITSVCRHGRTVLFIAHSWTVPSTILKTLMRASSVKFDKKNLLKWNVIEIKFDYLIIRFFINSCFSCRN